MSICIERSADAQARRQQLKQLDQRMQQLAVSGAGLSPWEAKELVVLIGEVYFADPALREAKDGQLKYQCVAAEEGPGKPLDKCRMVPVWLTLFETTDRHQMTGGGLKAECVELRQRRLMRMCEEARDQGGLLSQEDLAQLLMVDVRTIRRDVAALRRRQIIVPTRGQQQDIGPGVSHRELAVRHWLEGHEPLAVARTIKHSLRSTERYLETFKRVAYLREKQFAVAEIALIVGISMRGAETFAALCDRHRHRTYYRQRLAEIEQVGQAYYLAEGEKRGSTWSPATTPARRQP